MNELTESISNYIHIRYTDFDKEYNDLFKNIYKIKEFERPDGYIIINEVLYAIEHFEFDSSKSEKKKGSKNRQELGRILRTFDKLPNNTQYDDTLNVRKSTGQYIENLFNNFQNHYKKIDSYLNNIIDHIHGFKKIKLGFFIEDTTTLGNSYITTKENSLLKPYSLHVAFCKEFIDLFEKSTKLDFCFCAIKNSNKKSLDFISKTNVHLYKEVQINCSQIEIINMPVKIYGANIYLPLI